MRLVTKIIQEERIKYAVPVYDLDNQSNISDDDVALTKKDVPIPRVGVASNSR